MKNSDIEFNKFYVAIFKKTGKHCVILNSLLGSQVQFEAGGMTFTYMLAELGCYTDFEFICEL